MIVSVYTGIVGTKKLKEAEKLVDSGGHSEHMKSYNKIKNLSKRMSSHDFEMNSKFVANTFSHYASGHITLGEAKKMLKKDLKENFLDY